MSNSVVKIPVAINEPVLSYAPSSAEKKLLKEEIVRMKQSVIEIPMWIGGEKVFTAAKKEIRPPHETSHLLGTHAVGEKVHVEQAITAALAAKLQWENMPWEERAAIFLKAADLLTGPYRAKMNAATMLGQSKNVFQAEIDAVCELADFFRFNAQFMMEMYSQQPQSPRGTWNRMEYRALEGFVFALTPFNFTSIAANLCAAPAMMGNTVVWKPAETQIYSAQVIMEIYEEAGLPPGVINLVFVDGSVAGDVIFQHPDFAGLHFTGSTGVFQKLWKTIGENIANYKSYPRIVGETGGKDFVVAHPSARAKEVAIALARGAFEYQGQKCSAASRAYIPVSLWDEVKTALTDCLNDFKMGNPEDFRNFINAVIDEKAFDKITSFIAKAKQDSGVEVVCGGSFDKSNGYFIEPTVLRVNNPDYVTMCEELFGPVLTIYVYADEDYENTLQLVDQTGTYALTGAIFSQDRYALKVGMDALRHAAGNFYINDKPTGAVVGQQPFGGARASGTNDKAGSILNLFRWVSARTIKETFVPPIDYRYPFLGEE
ncbi:MAG: L-glutamate gamma-semialdehyde dehydrogenase [Saprospiraceae bacterium]|nr:L-glutamate gamma-semialdehyde dehydrogenase [Saprospiraceae bacterium]